LSRSESEEVDVEEEEGEEGGRREYDSIGTGSAARAGEISAVFEA
jgi:hypothetical protein